MKRMGILYICTGKYELFWKEYFESCEKHLFKEGEVELHYFVFTDAQELWREEESHVHRIFQEALPWPYITLDRFDIFLGIEERLARMDYLYFFNANLLLVEDIGADLLPRDGKDYAFLQHPGFFNKSNHEFTYERNAQSLAFVPMEKGEAYFAGGLNGGHAKPYLDMCHQLRDNIEKDKEKELIAVWHDESHLNRFAVDNMERISILDPSYGYPEQGWDIPFKAKIIIRNKKKMGGHRKLRGQKTTLAQRFRKWFR